jgi:hypothetical protein
MQFLSVRSPEIGVAHSPEDKVVTLSHHMKIFPRIWQNGTKTIERFIRPSPAIAGQYVSASLKSVERRWINVKDSFMKDMVLIHSSHVPHVT